MSIVLKFVLFLLLAASTLLLGYFLYRFLNKRVQESETGWQLLGNSLLLFVALAALLTICIFLLIYIYQFMQGENADLSSGAIT
jgi:ABC-type Fe3+ transport system permease subunit